mmetsp:Transcript_11656/g.16788  ORF Transcript_11656/g.16788 Transcript_11656/m.16788 type:complete len:456 (+) Transcript_11656:737-2104(+)
MNFKWLSNLNICQILCVTLVLPFTKSHNIITEVTTPSHDNRVLFSLDGPTTGPAVELAVFDKLTDDVNASAKSSPMKTDVSALSSIQRLKEALLQDSIEPASTEDVLIIESELLSNYYGINSTTQIDRVAYSSIRHSAVDENNAEANYFLGLICLYSLVPQTSGEFQEQHCAIKHFRSAAVAGHPTAQCAFGVMYFLGVGRALEKNNAVAIEWFRRATQQHIPNPRSHWLLARSLYEEWAAESNIKERRSGDFSDVAVKGDGDLILGEIIDLLQTAKLNGIPDAVHLLAVLYEYGKVPTLEYRGNNAGYYEENMAKAFALYYQASELGFPESTYHLGLMHAYGRGIAQNFVAAMECFRRGSIHLAHAPSMRYLAILAANGNSFAYGIPHYGLAVYWFDKCHKATGHQSTRALCLEEKIKLLHLMIGTLGEDATYDLIYKESLLTKSKTNLNQSQL